ncbi:Glutathione S-transferase kappa 1 [Mortierella sp. GBA43]|nr:Glutathione S-transferase kappa 1 [Mortierella sp. GBA43]
MTSRASILFYYDVVSPYSYIGVKLLNRYIPFWKDVDVVYQPTFLGGIMNLRDLNRISSATGIPFRFPSKFPLLTIQPMRLLLVLQKHESDKYIQCIEKVNNPGMGFGGHGWHSGTGVTMEEYWFHDKNIIEKEVLVESLAPILGSAEKVEKYLEMTGNKEVKDALLANTEKALEYGAFGAPTMVVKTAGSDKEHLFFGSDRYELMANLLGKPYPGLTFQATQSKL